MLLFLSDLHLTDSVDRSTIDLTRLAEALDHQLARAVERKGVRDVTLILLGDIFELLKSPAWLDDRGLRPWDAATPDHGELIAEIFDAVVRANRTFLDDLCRLTHTYPLKLRFLVGNHDFYLNTEMGAQARRRLQELLPLSRMDGRPFESVFLDGERYRVMAKHGHEWDPTNRYGDRTAAIGDAVVVELLLRLPTLVAKALHSSEEDPRLAFLHELDNVRPQHPRALAYWLLAGLDRLEMGLSARQAVDDGLHKIAKELIQLTSRVEFESTRQIRWWVRFLIKTARALLRKPGMLAPAVHLPWGGHGPSSYRQDALRNLEDAIVFGADLRYVLCGHTHLHELVPLETSRGGSPLLYINTGTWRRTHRLAEVAFRRTPRTFSTWQEECLVCIYDQEEQKRGLPPYEVYRYTSG